MNNTTTKRLVGIGACWATRSDKFVGTNDGYGAKPSYHVHPHASNPRERDILRFYTKAELNKWISAVEKSQKASTPSEAVDIMDTYWSTY